MAAQQSGTFTLRIRFVGLCFFLPRPGEGYLHVLLPGTSGPEIDDHHHAHEGRAAGEQSADPCVVDDTFEVGKHRLVMLYHPAYVDPSVPLHPPTAPRSVDLTNTPVTLLLDEPRGNISGLPDGVLNLHDVFAGERTRSDLYANPEGPPHVDLAGRVSLRAATYNDRRGGAHWTIKHTGGPVVEHEMSPVLEYVIPNVPGNTLQWRVFSAGGAPQIPVLTARDGEIELYIYHGPRVDIPGRVPINIHQPETPQRPVCADHVAAFYHLLDTPRPWEKPLPKFARHPVSPTSGGSGSGLRLLSVSVYTCMSGGGQP